MCTKVRRKENRSVCLTESNKRYPHKKFHVTLLRQILHASYVDLMTEIKVCKTIRMKIYFIFHDMNC